MQYFLKRVLNNEPLELYEGGRAYRNYLFVDDTCHAVKHLIDNGGLNEIYNVGYKDNHTLREIIDYAIQKTGSTSQIIEIPVPEFHRKIQMWDYKMDVSKLLGTGFEYKYDVWRGIDLTMEGL